MEQSELLRSIPKVDELLQHPAIMEAESEAPRSLIVDIVRTTLDALREAILAGAITQLPTTEQLVEHLLGQIRAESADNLRRVINGTGVVLHTNLGRSRLAPEALHQVVSTAIGYSNLEYNLTFGTRGSRYDHVVDLLTNLTGAEDALVVNNNAGAALLVLSALTSGGEVVVSRGELVEIGGAFRVPDIMAQSGSVLREVGTTNKTHYRDYQNAIDPERTKALMKVHTSNFKVVGFTEEVPLEKMVTLAHSQGLLALHDLGSGALVNLSQFGIHDEPSVQESVEAGVDVVCFSGDKLLGGPQAGIILGKRECIAAIKKHPLTRALRIDKMTLAALEATLRLYLDPEKAVATIPTLSMLAATRETLRPRAQALLELLQSKELDASLELADTEGQVGGGSVPTHVLPSVAVSILPHSISLEALEEGLRHCNRPLVGRVSRERFLLDLRTIEDEEFEDVAFNLHKCLGK